MLTHVDIYALCSQPLPSYETIMYCYKHFKHELRDIHKSSTIYEICRRTWWCIHKYYPLDECLLNISLQKEAYEYILSLVDDIDVYMLILFINDCIHTYRYTYMSIDSVQILCKTLRMWNIAYEQYINEATSSFYLSVYWPREWYIWYLSSAFSTEKVISENTGCHTTETMLSLSMSKDTLWHAVHDVDSFNLIYPICNAIGETYQLRDMFEYVLRNSRNSAQYLCIKWFPVVHVDSIFLYTFMKTLQSKIGCISVLCNHAFTSYINENWFYFRSIIDMSSWLKNPKQFIKNFYYLIEYYCHTIDIDRTYYAIQYINDVYGYQRTQLLWDIYGDIVNTRTHTETMSIVQIQNMYVQTPLFSIPEHWRDYIKDTWINDRTYCLVSIYTENVEILRELSLCEASCLYLLAQQQFATFTDIQRWLQTSIKRIKKTINRLKKKHKLILDYNGIYTMIDMPLQ